MLNAAKDGVTLLVHLRPGAKKTAITGIYGAPAHAQLKISVQAPAIEGRANAALTAFLAKIFSLPKADVRLISGERSRTKVVLLRGIALGRAEQVLLGSPRS